jgi:hypothetical protein
MSIGFLNYDSSFIQIELEGIKSTDLKEDISKHIISIEIVEEMNKIITGSIQLLDDDKLRFTNSLKGRKIGIKWGYSNIDWSGQQAFKKSNEPREMFSPMLVNRYVQGTIRNPSGSGDDKGTILYNCGFYGAEFDNSPPMKNKPNHNSGTKGSLVEKIFKDMGIDVHFVNFKRQNEVITRQTAIRQDGSNFRFLTKYANEWRTMFRIATNNKNKQVGLFCDYDNDDMVKAFLAETLGITGDTSTFEYKLTNLPNVRSYSWSYGQGGSGAGDNVRVAVVNGKTEFYYMKADTEQIVYYKLDTKKMERELAKRSDIKEQTQWLQEMLGEADKGFDNLVDKKFFFPVNASTAPQGVGLTLTMETIGNPLHTCPARAKFGAGFPDMFQTTDPNGKKKPGLIFYQTKVVHNISRDGYSNTITIADSFSTSGGSLVG